MLLDCPFLFDAVQDPGVAADMRGAHMDVPRAGEPAGDGDCPISLEVSAQGASWTRSSSHSVHFELLVLAAMWPDVPAARLP